DALLDEAARALDPERRLALLAQAEERLMVELAPILPLYYFTSAYVLRPGKFEGIYENGRDVHPPKAIRRVGS
ncbi:MAG: peptide ABC transporter substrate-binding protein, partial [Planctomycetes bacterium]|nr:peptide ABC transporter substrate-binding protein [Planctomycetota bacterium]